MFLRRIGAVPERMEDTVRKCGFFRMCSSHLQGCYEDTFSLIDLTLNTYLICLVSKKSSLDSLRYSKESKPHSLLLYPC
jgi:hypothetical protein